jgi:hypothetical protein
MTDRVDLEADAVYVASSALRADIRAIVQRGFAQGSPTSTAQQLDALLRPLVAELATLRAQRDAALALHRRDEVEGRATACVLDQCDHADECPTEMFPVCLACFTMVEPLCDDETALWPVEVMWPCPTSAALGVQPEPDND